LPGCAHAPRRAGLSDRAADPAEARSTHPAPAAEPVRRVRLLDDPLPDERRPDAGPGEPGPDLGLRAGQGFDDDKAPADPPRKPDDTRRADRDEGWPDPPRVAAADDPNLSRPRAERRGEGGGPSRAEEEEDEEEEEEDELDGYIKPNLLNDLLRLDDSPVKLFGWVQGSFTANPRLSSDGQNFGVNPNNLANAWTFQQVYFVVEKRVAEGDQPDLGFRFDNLFGNDWQNFHAVGLFDRAFRVDHFGYDPVQMYGELHLPWLTLGGLDIKGGRFYSLAGYEDGMAPSRPLLSTGYLFSYAHPFTQFGMMTTWHLTDRINLYNGAVNGWDRWINQHYKWGYAGGASWDSADERTNLALTINWGPDQISRDPATAAAQDGVQAQAARPAVPGRRPLGFGGKDTGLFTTVLTHEWTEDFSTIIEADQAFQNAVPGIGPGGRPQNASWYGLSGWALYDLTDRLTGVGRAEVFRDNNGVRTGFADTFYETTLGLIYKPRPWLWLRPEARFDWAQKTHPYDDARHSDQFTFGFDLIFLF
jgi:hypothetical protein